MGVVVERVDDFPRYDVVLERLDTAPVAGVILGYEGPPEIIGRTSEAVLIVLRRSDRPVVLRLGEGGEAGVGKGEAS